MGKAAFVLAGMIALANAAWAAEIHVAVDGKDANPGTLSAPLRTIQRAADLARPGDVITVHAGVYRERVNPPRGGESDAKRITYQAAPGREGRDQGLGGRQGLGQGPGRRLEGGPPQFVLRRLQSLRRPHPRRLVRAQGPRASHRRGLSRRRMADRGGQRWTTSCKPAGRRRSGSRQVDNGHDDDLGPVQGRRSQRAAGRDQRPPDRLLSRPRPASNYHHRARLHHAARGHPLGAADGRAGRAHRHELEQGLDHREERRQPLRLLRHRPRQARRRTSTTPRRTPPRATSRRSSAAWPGAGTRTPSAATSSATTPSPTANRPASSAAWARPSARSRATPSTTSTSAGSSRARRWPASSSTAPSTS